MLAKTDAEGVRAHNRRVVIDQLRRSNVSTRRAVSAATGLSVSSASAITAALIRDGVLVEAQDDERGLKRGRPERRLGFEPGAATVAAVKIAVGEIAVRISDYAGQPLAYVHRTLTIADLDADRMVAAIADLVREAEGRVERLGQPATERLTLAVQGKTDAEAGRIVWSPAMKHRDLVVGPKLSQALGATVSVCNDCSLMPESVRWRGGTGARDFAFLFIGFGVGMGLRIGGRTFQDGTNSAVEFGHINHVPGGAACRCGNSGCVEAYAGDYAIWRRALGRPVGEIIDRRISDAEIHRLANEARRAQGNARTAFEEAGIAIGYGLGRLFTIIDPLPIIFTGAGAHAIDLMEPAIRRGIAESSIAEQGADVAFSVEEDVDALVFEAATNHALAGIDERFARSPGRHAEAAE